MQLLELLRDLNRFDINQMSPVRYEFLRSTALKRFRSASAALPPLLLPGAEVADAFTWSCYAPEDVFPQWLSTFSVLPSRFMEGALGQEGKVRHAMALFPPVKLSVDLFGRFNYPNPSREGAPFLSIALRVEGDPGLAALQCASGEVFAGLAAARSAGGFQISIVRPELACDEISCGDALAGEVFRCAEELRLSSDDPDDFSAFELRLTVSALDRFDEEHFQQAVSCMGALLRSCSSFWTPSDAFPAPC